MKSIIFSLGIIMLFAGALALTGCTKNVPSISDKEVEEINNGINDVQETQKVVDEGNEIENDLVVEDNNDDLDVDDIESDLSELDELENLDDFDFNFS